MKDFKFENDFGGGDVDVVLEERLDTKVDLEAKPTAGPAIAKQMAETGMAKKVEASSAALEQLEPQTPAQEVKKGFLSRVKNFFGGKEKTPEYYMEVGMQAINSHPMKIKAYETFNQEDPAKAAKYARAVGKNPDVKYWAYDESKQDFIDKTQYSVASGEGTAGA